MNLTLHVWRQKNRTTPGKMVKYPATNVSEDMSFLEMLDIVNEELIHKNEEPIAFDHDCREGICGSCSLVLALRTLSGYAGGSTRSGIVTGPSLIRCTCMSAPKRPVWTVGCSFWAWVTKWS